MLPDSAAFPGISKSPCAAILELLRDMPMVKFDRMNLPVTNSQALSMREKGGSA